MVIKPMSKLVMKHGQMLHTLYLLQKLRILWTWSGKLTLKFPLHTGAKMMIPILSSKFSLLSGIVLTRQVRLAQMHMLVTLKPTPILKLLSSLLETK
jgi:hypothetical protein